MRSRSIAALLGLLALIAVAVVSASPAAVGTDTSALRSAVTVDAVMAHAEEFQAIADANGGTRVATSPGYDASAAYVAGCGASRLHSAAVPRDARFCG